MPILIRQSDRSTRPPAGRYAAPLLYTQADASFLNSISRNRPVETTRLAPSCHCDLVAHTSLRATHILRFRAQHAGRPHKEHFTPCSTITGKKFSRGRRNWLPLIGDKRYNDQVSDYSVKARTNGLPSSRSTC